ncbi:hypothetical protein [Undibacterium crateris]|uniref:hypothetical protein n=1 Tax=Undibacterium crateris TaxID=2528175 RepID=UPI001389FB33|nr:hypothetical protein [Undibacterium crateris]NDI85485.1 hypothetical protein [Undibacterium crateris]
MKSVSEIKMMVLDLQSIEHVSGGYVGDMEIAVQSTESISCGTVTANELSTKSNGCPRETKAFG